MKKNSPQDITPPCELILGNSNKRFSGVTSTMLQTFPHLEQLINFRVLGKHHLPNEKLNISFRELLKLCKTPLPNGKSRIFHARRNDEMIQALIIRDIFRCDIKILFTSTAQRYHSGFTRWLMSKMDTVISTCKAAASYLTPPPSTIIAHGVEPEVYFPTSNHQDSLKKLGIHTTHAVGIFGRVRQQKGVDLFVKACIETLPKHPEFTAIIVGSITPSNQTFVDELKLLINEAGLSERIVFLGEQPFNTIPILFRSMSLVAALSQNEGFGLTVLEALSSGTAVLATEAGAWSEIVREGVDGHIVPIGDQQAINDALEKMLSQPDQLKTMGENGRERILENYTIEREVESLVKVYRSLQ